MKKNVSINISGIIFHIEEDGYDQLKEYLESINRYFSTFDDSHEIIADIESRIAEIFLSKLKDGQQVIVLENVEELIATMGSIKDFQAAEEDAGFTSNMEDIEEELDDDRSDYLFSKRLYRDNNRKLVAGVLSGISHYFNVDPLWIRLIYVLLFFGVSILPPVTGFLFLAYIVFWIIVPSSDDLREEKKIKKMFRNPDEKVLGGVASGMSAYFGIDVVIVRLLFFITIFMAGTGLILYFILWIILPEAKSMTDKMEMQGQPVTLSNIEFNIKKSLNVNDGDENLLLKILLFPFRMIAALFEFMSKALGPLMLFIMEALRVVFGVILTILGISGVLSVLMLFGVIIGLLATNNQLNEFYHIPFEIIRNDISMLPAVALSIALIIPFFYLAILGFIILMKKQVLNSKASWSILAIWLISMIILSFTIPRFITNFKDNGRFTTVDRLPLYDKTAVLRFNDIGEDEFDLVSMKIRSYEDTIIKLEREFRASGATRKKAVENAKLIGYVIDVQDSIITFDSSIEFSKDAKFRKQHMDITLYLPIGQKFMLDKNMKFLLGSYMYRAGFSNSDMGDNVWQYNDDGLHCVSCPEDIINNKNDSTSWGITGFQRSYEIDDFDEIDINTAFRINIKQGDEYSIFIAGEKNNVNNVIIEKSGNVLSMDFKDNSTKHNDEQKEIKVFIIMPFISSVQFGSTCKVNIFGFKQDYMDINLSGAAFANLDVEINSLNADITGAAKLQIKGSGRKFKANVSGASTLNAYDFEVYETEIETHSASTARVYAKDQLFIITHGASTVTYKGNADVEIEKSGISSVNKEY